MQLPVDKRENVYFILKVVFTILVLFFVIFGADSLFRSSQVAMLSTVLIFAIYILIIWLFIAFQKMYMVAFIKGNGVAISERQFPDIYAAYTEMAQKIGLKKVPKLFLVQEGGLLNAFAVRFSGRNYIAIYSEVFSLLHSDINSVKFVLGHELGHVRRNHMSKRFWTFPSSLVPFLSAAYSRSCEYTCDNIGKSVISENPLNGMLLLASGPHLYKEINHDAYVEDAKQNYTFGVRFMHLFMSHPYLPKRLENLNKR